MELEGRVEQLRREGYGVAAISYDPTAVLADFSDRRGITFPLLSDAGSAIIKRFGILNTTVAADDPTYGIPFPGTFVLDERGRVVSRSFETAYQERDTISTVLLKLGRRLDVSATKLATPHLTITTYASDQTIAPGTHFSLVLDIAPRPKIHVYAPGVAGYRPIALRVQAQPGIRLGGLQTPQPETYYFAPLKERVLVYQRPFRIVQDVVADATASGQAALKDLTTLTIHAIFEYQACDDKVCFRPESVPLSWTLGVKVLDRERPRR